MTAPIQRSFDIRLERQHGDQRLLGGCCVPFNTPTVVSDGGPAYREMFVAGCFTRQLSAPNRVELRYRHGDTLLDRVGHAVTLAEHDDGLWGTFKVRDGVLGDQALALVDEGLLTGLSISGVPVRSTTADDGTVVRRQLNLEHVGLCESPAYATAGVSMRRTRQPVEPAPTFDAALTAVAYRQPLNGTPPRRTPPNLGRHPAPRHPV